MEARSKRASSSPQPAFYQPPVPLATSSRRVPPRFQSGKEVSAYSGLVPRQHHLREMDRRGCITRRSPALLRKTLLECAWCMICYNAWARGIYQRLTGAGQRRKKQAIVALARQAIRCAAWQPRPIPDPRSRL
jgi:transposase